jgi:hypothetical protein
MEYKDLPCYKEALKFLNDLCYKKINCMNENWSVYNDVEYKWEYKKDDKQCTLLYVKNKESGFYVIENGTKYVIQNIDHFIKEHELILRNECDNYKEHQNVLSILMKMPYYSFQLKHQMKYVWVFFKNNVECKLEYIKGSIFYEDCIGVSKDCIRRFILTDVNKEKDIDNIDDIMKTYKEYLDTRNVNLKNNEKIVKSLKELLGENDSQCLYEIGWFKKSNKIQIKVILNTLKDLNKKEIELKYKIKDESWQTKYISSKSLITFLKKYEKQLNETTHGVEILEEKLNELSIKEEVIKEKNTEYIEKNIKQINVKNCNLFIYLPKQHRIAIQTCKEEKDEYENAKYIKERDIVN